MTDTNDSAKLLKPFGVELDLDEGCMLNPEEHLERKASDMRGHYADEQALERLIETGNDPLHYEVFEVPVPRKAGQLMYCISKLQPGLVGDECFMTKGHYHTIADTAEIYLCLRGEGLTLMKTSDGRCEAVKMQRGVMVYVPPFWAHRSVNTGDEPLISFCIYPGHAGHNYGDIEKEGFPKRVFMLNGEVTIE